MTFRLWRCFKLQVLLIYIIVFWMTILSNIFISMLMLMLMLMILLMLIFNIFQQF